MVNRDARCLWGSHHIEARFQLAKGGDFQVGALRDPEGTKYLKVSVKWEL